MILRYSMSHVTQPVLSMPTTQSMPAQGDHDTCISLHTSRIHTLFITVLCSHSGSYLEIFGRSFRTAMAFRTEPAPRTSPYGRSAQHTRESDSTMDRESDLYAVHHAVGRVITADNPVMLLPQPGSTVRVVTVITWQSSRMTY
jgi:hypothetical protein